MGKDTLDEMMVQYIKEILLIIKSKVKVNMNEQMVANKKEKLKKIKGMDMVNIYLIMENLNMQDNGKIDSTQEFFYL